MMMSGIVLHDELATLNHNQSNEQILVYGSLFEVIEVTVWNVTRCIIIYLSVYYVLSCHDVQVINLLMMYSTSSSGC